MKATVITRKELPATASYQVDRLDDPIEFIQKNRKKITPTSFKEALEVFEKDPLAYALRWVPQTTLHPDSRGQLVAYKESDFPKDLPFLVYQAAAIPRSKNGILPEDSYLHWLSLNATEEFRQFYWHFPELMGRFHREVFLGLSHIQFAAMSKDAEKVYNWSTYVAELIDSHIAYQTRYENSEESLKHEDCVRFLEISDEPQAKEALSPFDAGGETVQSKLGTNATCRENVIQAVKSMFWNDVDQILIQEQLSLFRKDLLERQLDNPMVYLEDESEVFAMDDPGELYYFILMDDFWIRQFAYWMFNRHIKMFYELHSKKS